MKFEILIEYLIIALAVACSTIGLKVFLLPNGFLDGGVTGIAMLIGFVSGLNVPIILVGLSLPFIYLAYQHLSKRIAIKSVVAITLLGVCIHFFPSIPLTEDKLLIAVFGGLFLGAGIGLAIRNGCVLDGAEVLGVYVHDRFGFEIGQIILIFNVILFMVTAFVMGVEPAMYGILTYIVTAKVTDHMIEGFEDFIGFTISSDHIDEIEELIKKEMHAGITVLPVIRGHGSKGIKTNHKIIQTVINRIDIKHLYRIIHKVDQHAFVIEFDVNTVKGGLTNRWSLKDISQIKNHLQKGNSLTSEPAL